MEQSEPLRRYLAFSVISSVAVIAPEGLAVPVARELGGGVFDAGILTATVPAGFVISSFLILRLAPERRLQLLFPLSLLCMVPLIASPLATNVYVVMVLWVVSGLGACLNLVASAAYIQACPPDYRSRAYGVAVTTLYGCQGVALLLSGFAADLLTATGAVAVISGAMLVLLLARPGLWLRQLLPAAQDRRDLVRSTRG